MRLKRKYAPIFKWMRLRGRWEIEREMVKTYRKFLRDSNSTFLDEITSLPVNDSKGYRFFRMMMLKMIQKSIALPALQNPTRKIGNGTNG